MNTDNTQDAAEPALASAGSHIDLLSVLRTLAEGVRGMGIGDPDSGSRVEASDVVRWAVAEIERLRLTDAEREAIATAVAFCESTTAPLPRSEQIVTLRALLERTK
jgi:hypothetical protein